MTPALLAALREATRSRTPVVLATRLADGIQFLLPDEDPASIPPGLAVAAAAALAAGRSSADEVDGATWFLEVRLPSPRLLIVGAVHIAQSLAPLAAAIGLETTVIDPRISFATEERFPGIALRHDWPDEAIAAIGADSHAAIAILTHDPKLDDPAIEAALATDMFYVGVLGSRRTHRARLDRLAARGHDAAALARIRGPVGLAIGAVTSAEIALSIVAEIVAVHRGAALAIRTG